MEKKPQTANYQKIFDLIKGVIGNTGTDIGDIAKALKAITGDEWTEEVLRRTIIRIEARAKKKGEPQVFPELELALKKSVNKAQASKKKRLTRPRDLELNQPSSLLPVLFVSEGRKIHQVLKTWPKLQEAFPLPMFDNNTFYPEAFESKKQAAINKQLGEITETEARDEFLQYILGHPKNVALYLCHRNSQPQQKDVTYNLLLKMILEHNELIVQKKLPVMKSLIGIILYSYGPEYAWEFYRKAYKSFRSNKNGAPFAETSYEFRDAIIAQVIENYPEETDKVICSLIEQGFKLTPKTTPEKVAKIRGTMKFFEYLRRDR